MPKRRVVAANDDHVKTEPDKLRDGDKYWEDMARHFDDVRKCALNGLVELSAHDRDNVCQLIGWLTAAIAELRPPAPVTRSLVPEHLLFIRQRAANVASLTHGALTIFYGGDAECLSLYCKTLFGASMSWSRIRGKALPVPVAKLPVFTRALVESLLKRARGWRDAVNPLEYIVTHALNTATKESWADISDVDAVPLDEITGTAAESADADTTVERVYSFAGLKKAAAGDLEVLAYISGLETIQNFDKRETHRQIRKQMGWNTHEASKIRARLQRLLQKAPEYLTQNHHSVSDASRTVFFETYYGGAKGRPHGDWVHKKPRRDI